MSPWLRAGLFEGTGRPAAARSPLGRRRALGRLASPRPPRRRRSAASARPTARPPRAARPRAGAGPRGRRRPTSCTPIGRPSTLDVQRQRDRRLAGGVEAGGEHGARAWRVTIGISGFSGVRRRRSRAAAAAAASVGVSSRSKPLAHQPAAAARDDLRVLRRRAGTRAAVCARPISASAQVSGSTSSCADLAGRSRRPSSRRFQSHAGRSSGPGSCGDVARRRRARPGRRPRPSGRATRAAGPSPRPRPRSRGAPRTGRRAASVSRPMRSRPGSAPTSSA